jgi:hypothetical protein
MVIGPGDVSVAKLPQKCKKVGVLTGYYVLRILNFASVARMLSPPSPNRCGSSPVCQHMCWSTCDCTHRTTVPETASAKGQTLIIVQRAKARVTDTLMLVIMRQTLV